MIKRQSVAHLGTLKQIFKDNRQFIHVVEILEEEMALDGGSYNLKVEIVYNAHECFVNCTFNPHLHGPVLKGDIWVCCFINGDLRHGFLLQKISNLNCPIHPKAREGETVLSSRANKKINVSNDQGAMLDQNAVLGPKLVEWLLKLTEEIKNLADDIESLKTWATSHIHTSAAPGSPTTMPVVSPTTSTAPEKTAIQQLERETETKKFLSDLLYIQEKDLTNSPEE